MTDQDIAAALELAEEARNRANVMHAARETPQFAHDIIPSLEHILYLGIAVRRLVAEVRTLRAILADATSEAAMYQHGHEAAIRTALVMVEEAQAIWREVGLARAVKLLRALLPPSSLQSAPPSV